MASIFPSLNPNLLLNLAIRKMCLQPRESMNEVEKASGRSKMFFFPDVYDLTQPKEFLSLPDLFLTSLLFSLGPICGITGFVFPLLAANGRFQVYCSAQLGTRIWPQGIRIWPLMVSNGTWSMNKNLTICDFTSLWEVIRGLPCLLSPNSYKQILVQYLLRSSYHLLYRMLCNYWSQERDCGWDVLMMFWLLFKKAQMLQTPFWNS